MLEVDGLRNLLCLTAVSDVSFTVGAGETIGLLGLNGAGKSTTVGMIAGWLRPDAARSASGRALAGDTDPAKSAIGLVPQDLALFEDLPARENLRFFGALYRLGGPALEAAIATGLTFVGLAERARDKVKTFSGGMKRRLNLAAGLLHDPQLVLLDEPTVGIDPQSRNAIFDNLEALRARGKALVSPRTTWKRPSGSATASRSWTTAAIANDTVRGLYGSPLLPAAQRGVEGDGRRLAEALRALPSGVGGGRGRPAHGGC